VKRAHPSCPILKSAASTLSNENENLDKVKKMTTYFTHNCCKRTGPPHLRTAVEYGHFDQVFHYTMENITQEFQNNAKHILSAKRGAGYWLWKPWIILDTIVNRANDCDIVCYCDAVAWWNNTASPLWELASKISYGVLTFNHVLSGWKYMNLTERYWSKRDAYVLLGVDVADMYDTIIRKATFSCFQKNPDAIHFLNEWLYFSLNENIITDSKSQLLAEIPLFKENRHDQTILSLLSKKYGIPAFADPSQYGEPDRRKFGKVVNHWKQPWIIKHTRGKQ